MIAAFDVHYCMDGKASAAAVLFNEYGDVLPVTEYTMLLTVMEDYMPGQFYRRELPCIAALLVLMSATPREVIVDGYVMLGDRPGLGRHLFEYLHCMVSVIGVARSQFKSASGVRLFRGLSTRPLYVTAAGMDPQEASEKIRHMHGRYRGCRTCKAM